MNYSRLKTVCNAPIKAFESVGQVTKTKDGIYIYQDNGSNILAVAHLDTVLNSDSFRVHKRKGNDYVSSESLDDRLGVYVILDLLPRMGINVDVLLTEGEETGNSTAQHFKANKPYNWMFSFDRRGDGVVMYQYDDTRTRELLKPYGLNVHIGSFSDIAFLEHLGIKGFNFGTAYYGEHSQECHANMSLLKAQLTKFAKFYNDYKGTQLKHERTERPSYYGVYNPSYSARFGGWAGYDDLYCYMCESHIGTHRIMDGLYLCEQCFNEAGQCSRCMDIVPDYELYGGICENCISKSQNED